MKRLEFCKQERAITLIALIITIIVLLILAGITTNFIFGENGIIERAIMSAFVTQMRDYEEEINLKILQDSMVELSGSDKKYFLGLDGQESIKTLLPDIKRDYEAEVIVQDNVMYYKYIGTGTSKKRVKWCFEVDIPVWGYGSYDDFLKDIGEEKPVVPGITPPGSEYKKIGNIYMQTPDLSGFNPEATYYVTYNGEAEQIAGRIDRIETPSDWYNYEDKRWANIVTVNDSDVSYWVWIPKYTYIANEAEEFIDAKFISQEGDVYKDANGNIVELMGYEIPESFTFGEQNLAGFWMSKYEVSEEAATTEAVSIAGNETSISVTTSNPSGNYQVYVDGKLNYTGTLPYIINNLQTNKTYDVFVWKEAGSVIGRKKVTTQAPTAISVDVSQFNPENTFYVYWDEAGNEHCDIPISQPAPENWYNYSEKKWANIVTVNDSSVSYWVWVPRYEYKAYDTAQFLDINFIPSTKTQASGGYEIPESFTFGGQNLSGYWMSKYEVSDETIAPEVLICAENETSISVTTSNPNGNYKVYINGELKHTGTLPHVVEKLKVNTRYNVLVIKENGGPIGRKVLETKAPTAITVDYSTFEPSSTFYVYWDENGEEHSDIPISQSPPANWYNYAEKRWANIVTKAHDKIAYWVWVPRYEYKVYDTAQYVDIKFIPTTQTIADGGYEIPESFTFGGQDLAGFWMSKYEVSE